jgi:hypothetical protein
MRLLISFTTYPRDGKTTYGLLENTFKSLIENYDKNIIIKIIVVGDDYTNIDELKPIFNNYDVDFFNININDALRNKKVNKEIKWMQAVQRSKIFIFEKALKDYKKYDYILMSSDDDIYINNKLNTSINYIKNNNNPDFVFNLGINHLNKIIPENNNIHYPEPYKCISSGCFYKLSNKKFINKIIIFRKNRWDYVINHYNLKDNIKPEDAELWIFLRNYFKLNIFKSILIPIVMINHSNEKSLFNYIK